MAYNPNTLEDPNNPQGGTNTGIASTPALSSAPTTNASSSVTPASGSSPAPFNPNAGSGASAGTGFTNIDQYINANSDAGNEINKRAVRAGDRATDDFQGAAQPANNALAAAPTAAMSDTQVGNLISGYNIGGPGHRNNSTDSGQDVGMSTLTPLANASWSGPTSFTYDPSQSQGIKTLGTLSNANAAGTEIASEDGTLSGYNPRMSAIDDAIYGGTASGQAATQGAAQNAAAQSADETNTANRINARLGAEPALQASIAATTQAQLNAIAQGDAATPGGIVLEGSNGPGAYDPTHSGELTEINRILGTSYASGTNSNGVNTQDAQNAATIAHNQQMAANQPNPAPNPNTVALPTYTAPGQSNTPSGQAGYVHSGTAPTEGTSAAPGHASTTDNTFVPNLLQQPKKRR